MTTEQEQRPVIQADRHIAVLRELKERTPVYMGEAPKAQHYQAIHAAYDAAMTALAQQPRATEAGPIGFLYHWPEDVGRSPYFSRERISPNAIGWANGWTETAVYDRPQAQPSGDVVEAFAWIDRLEWHKPAHRAVMASVKLGAWMSAALDDPKVCDAMKADIREWFSAGEPMEVLTQALAHQRPDEPGEVERIEAVMPDVHILISDGYYRLAAEKIAAALSTPTVQEGG